LKQEELDLRYQRERILSMVDISQIARDMKGKIEANPDKVIESPSLNKLQAERLRDNYLFNYKILGMDVLSNNFPEVSSYVLCVMHGGNQNA